MIEAPNKNTAPKFGKKLKDTDYYSYTAITEFIGRHPEWHKYGRKESVSDFDIDKFTTTTLKQLAKQNISIANFTQALITKKAG